MITVRSRVKRIFRPMRRFQLLDTSTLRAPVDLPLAEGEAPIGVYLNEPASLKSAIFVTDRSLILESEGIWTPIPYASIAEVMTPVTKTNVQGLSLLLHDGTKTWVSIQSGTERTSDAFEFLRFLRRVLADLQSAG